ncbi:hypothetical protein IC575_028128 [Cucumis melo]
MIEQNEGSSGITSPNEPETIAASPSRPREAKGVIGGEGGTYVRENEENSKRHGEEMLESSQPESRQNCIIDIKSNGESVDDEDSSEEKVCRICHLGSEHESITSDLIHLGCSCKDELGISHRDCAEIWFMHRGNRQCEICGQTATNVRRNRSSHFAIHRNERRLVASSTVSTVSLDNEVSLSCCWGQRFCNFLLTCTVLAFLLPWFFRADFFG